MTSRAALPSCLLLLSFAAAAGDLAVCPGEGARYQDFKCDHDPTHRVCAELLDAGGQPLNWGPKGNFWQITGQEAFQWDAEIRANHGDSWCICMWATARLIEAAGCENVHIDCAATDVAYVEARYTDGGTDLAPAKQCLMQKCPALVQKAASIEPVPVLEDRKPLVSSSGLAVAAMASLAFPVAAVAAYRMAVAQTGARTGAQRGAVDVEAKGAAEADLLE